MMTKGYDIILSFNQFLARCMWRIKCRKEAVYVQDSQAQSLWMVSKNTHLGLWPYVATLLPLPLDQREVKGLTGSSPNKQTHKFVFLFYWNLVSLISTFSLHYSLEYEMTNLLGSDIRCYGPYWDLHHLQKDQEMRRHKTLTWKVESSGKSWIVLALASFSRGDETGGNGPSTTDNEETELFMKESIDLSASRWCFKPHAPQWGAGVCCVLCFTNRRTNSSPEYSQT